MLTGRRSSGLPCKEVRVLSRVSSASYFFGVLFFVFKSLGKSHISFGWFSNDELIPTPRPGLGYGMLAGSSVQSCVFLTNTLTTVLCLRGGLMTVVCSNHHHRRCHLPNLQQPSRCRLHLPQLQTRLAWALFMGYGCFLFHSPLPSCAPPPVLISCGLTIAHATSRQRPQGHAGVHLRQLQPLHP